MARAVSLDSKRLYSWGWDSHAGPKNSKWLQENLKDMDSKMSLMIRLLEDDGDSFAKKAEMYYKRRPELMKLVEDVYRAYRALAERYDYVTGALRQAHRKIQEAFPDQIPSSPQTPDLGPEPRPIFEADEPPEESSDFDWPSFLSIKRNPGRRITKSMNELYPPGKARKGLNFLEDEVRRRKPREDEIIRLEEEESSRERCLHFETETAALKEELLALNEKMNQKLEEFKQQNLKKVKAEEEAERLKLENFTLNRHILSSDSIINTFCKKLQELESETIDLREKISNSKNENSDLILKYEEEKEKSLKVLDELEAIKEKARDLTARNDYLVDRLKKQTENSSALESSLSEAKDVICESREKIQKLDENNSMLESSLKDAKGTIDELKEKVQELTNSLIEAEEVIGESTEKIRKLSENNSALESSLKRSLSLSGAELELEREKNKSLEKSCGSLTTRIQDLCLENGILNQRLESVSKNNALLEKLLKKANEDIEGMREVLCTLTRELECVRVSFKDKEAVLASELEISLKESQDSFSRRVAELVAENGNLADQLEQITEYNALLENTLTCAYGTTEQLRETIQCLIKAHNEEKDLIQAQSEKQREHSSILEKSCESLNGRIEELALEKEGLILAHNEEKDLILARSEKQRENYLILEKSCESLNGRIEELVLEKESLILAHKEEKELILAQLEKQKENYLILEKSCESLKSRIEELVLENEEEKGSILAQLEKQRENNAILEKSLSEVRLKFEESCESFNNRIEELTLENEGLIVAHKGEKDSILAQLEKQRENNAMLEKSLSEVRLKFEVSCESFNSRIEELRLEKEGLILAHKEEKDLILAQSEKQRENNAVLEKSVSEIRLQFEESRESLNNRIEELTVENEGLILAHQEEKELILAQSEKQRENNVILEKSCESLNDSIEELRVENESLMQQLSFVNQRLEDVSKSSLELQTSLLDANEESTLLREQLVNLILDLERVQEGFKEKEAFLVVQKDKADEKSRFLEESCDSLNKRIAEVVHQLEVSFERNVASDSSLCDARFEIEDLREKVKTLDESVITLADKNSNLMSENISLASQLEGMLESMEILTRKHIELEGKQKDLEIEKETSESEVVELRSLLIGSQHDCQFKDEELEGIKEEILETEVRCLILEMHLLYADECFQELQKLFTDVKRKNLDQEKMISSISEHSKNLQDGIIAVMKIMGIKIKSKDDIVIKISDVKKLMLEIIDDNSFWILKDSISTTLLQQLGFNLMNLKLENSVKGERLLALEGEKHELLQSIHAVRCREGELMDVISELRDQIENLEEENRAALVETMCMTFLSLLYEQLAAERERILITLQEKVEELTQSSILLETQKGVLEVSVSGLSQQVELGKTLLNQRDLELDEALQRLKISEEANLQLCADADNMRVELSNSVCMIDELERKINDLMDEVALYEEEISKLWYDAQVSSLYAQIFEDKVFELMEKYDELAEKLILAQEGSDTPDKECGELKETLTAYIPLVLMLQESMRGLETEVFSLTKHRQLAGDQVQEESSDVSALEKTDPPSTQCSNAVDPYGFISLQKLQHKVEALQQLIRLSDLSTKSELEKNTHEKVAIFSDIEGRDREESAPTTRHHAMVAETCEKDDQMLRLWETAEKDSNAVITGKDDRGNSSSRLMRENEETLDQMMLPGNLGSRRDWSRRISGRLAGDAQRLLALHDSIQDLKAQMEKLASLGKKSMDLKALRGNFRVSERKSAIQKSLVEKLFVSGKTPTEQETLSEMSGNLGGKSTELDNRIEVSEISSKRSTDSIGFFDSKSVDMIGAPGKWSMEKNFETMAVRLRRVDEEVSAMFDVNADSARRAGSLSWEESMVKTEQKKQVFEEVQKGSERIGKLELELQKIRYIIFKIVEAREAKGRGGRRQPKTMLRDYLYGRREDSRGRKGWLNGCCILPNA